jgi:hypothetical protein
VLLTLATDKLLSVAADNVSWSIHLTAPGLLFVLIPFVVLHDHIQRITGIDSPSEFHTAVFFFFFLAHFLLMQDLTPEDALSYVSHICLIIRLTQNA